MYFRVKILSKDFVRFPSKSEFENFNSEIGLLFEDAGVKAYDLVEKYVKKAFEYNDVEEFIQNLQTFAKRAHKYEVVELLNLLTSSNWESFVADPRKLDSDLMENASAYWFVNNIFAEIISDVVQPIEALSLSVQVFGNGEDQLVNKEDTGKYGEIYPFSARLLMDAVSSNNKIGQYQLTGPIVDYFENLKGNPNHSLNSDEAFDFDAYPDHIYGIVWSATVKRDPIDDADDGEELAVYEIIVHPIWLGKDIKSNFETYPYSDYI